jgi:hypothetical protein
MDWIDLAQDRPVEDSCEHCSEPLSFIKCWEILESAQLAACQEGLSSMELVSGTVQCNSVIIVFFVDKNLIQLSEFLIIRTTFVTNSHNQHSVLLPYITKKCVSVL